MSFTDESSNEGYNLTVQKLAHRRLSEAEVGDDVQVVDAGQTYVGKIQAKTPDGRVKVSFVAGKRPNRDTFAANELKFGQTKPVLPGQQTVAPIRPAVVATGTANIPAK